MESYEYLFFSRVAVLRSSRRFSRASGRLKTFLRRPLCSYCLRTCRKQICCSRRVVLHSNQFSKEFLFLMHP